jgi:hypothetical protein
MLAAFESARADFEAGRFSDAAQGFRASLAAADGKDEASVFFIHLAEKLAEAPPEGWDGVVVFESK